MINRLIICVPVALYLNYLGVFLYLEGKNIGRPLSEKNLMGILVEFLSWLFALFFGFVGYISKLGFSTSAELSYYPKPIILWVALIVTIPLLYFFFPKNESLLSKLGLLGASIPAFLFAVHIVMGLIRKT